MKKSFLILFWTLLTLTIFANFVDKIVEKIENDTQYLMALNSYNNALNNLKMEESILKNIGINEGVFTSRFYDNNNFKQLEIPLSLNMKIYGFDIIGTLKYTSDFNNNNNSYSVSISKKLFSFDDLNNIDKKILLLSTKWELKNLKNSLFINTLKNAYYYNYYSNLLNLQKEAFEIRKQLFYEAKKKYVKGIIGKIEYLTLQKNYLNEKISINNLQISINKIKEYNIPDVILIELSMPSTITEIPLNREDIRAALLEVEKNKAKLKRKFVYDLPDINMGILMNYNKNDLTNSYKTDTTIFLNFSYNIFDNNYRQNTKKSMDMDYIISLKKYKNKLNAIFTEIKNIQEKINNDELQLKSIDLEKQISEINYETAKKQYEKGYLSLNELKLEKINMLKTHFEYERIKAELLFDKLTLYNVLGYDIISIFEEELNR
ncbi:outer membrane protein [Marinitoga piezophila KA3]|uniref:Outer membrane protein n=1 Tax=Marinitoga piezophila (strain DSM 14283 / JCM 11233 / KA3) TaxID=443254 RepID=H2J3P9_MARPK|nr:TolC family protein [Marinitoga piezophila]AEX85791.1 outer membrane protein [Marinitoga piezophila KA3]